MMNENIQFEAPAPQQSTGVNNTLIRNYRKFIPRILIKILMFIVGVLALIAAVVSCLNFFGGIYGILKGVVLILLLIPLSILLISSSFIRMKFIKTDRVLAGLTVAIFILLLGVYGGDIILGTLIEFVRILTYSQKDKMEDMDENPEFEKNTAYVEDQKGLWALITIFFACVGCFCFICCCCPCFIISILNCLHAMHPDKSKIQRDGEDEASGHNYMLDGGMEVGANVPYANLNQQEIDEGVVNQMAIQEDDIGGPLPVIPAVEVVPVSGSQVIHGHEQNVTHHIQPIGQTSENFKVSV